MPDARSLVEGLVSCVPRDRATARSDGPGRGTSPSMVHRGERAEASRSTRGRFRRSCHSRPGLPCRAMHERFPAVRRQIGGPDERSGDGFFEGCRVGRRIKEEDLTADPDTQLVTRSTGIFGNPAFPPDTLASAVPGLGPHRAAAGMSTESRRTVPGRSSAAPPIVATAPATESRERSTCQGPCRLYSWILPPQRFASYLSGFATTVVVMDFATRAVDPPPMIDLCSHVATGQERMGRGSRTRRSPLAREVADPTIH